MGKTLDFDGNGYIGVDEFIFGCTRFKGAARSLDLARVMHIQHAQSETLEIMTGNIEELQNSISKLISNPRSLCLSSTNTAQDSRRVPSANTAPDSRQKLTSNAEFDDLVVTMQIIREEGDELFERPTG